MKTYRKVLTIAGSDSGGGAGIQADLKTISALGCYGLSVITALTAQNTQGVTGIHPVPPAFVGEQITAVLSDIGADAVKIGMLYSDALIRTVREHLDRFGMKTVVLDPVMAAQSGDSLLEDSAIKAIREVLIPSVLMVTPNLPEAEMLLGKPIRDMKAMQDAARSISDFGVPYVLIKGGHADFNPGTDILYVRDTGQFTELFEENIKTNNNHGTGCTLSSAIASFLARGMEPVYAVRRAKGYITEAISAGAQYTIGRGHGPVHHFYSFWE